MKSIIYHRMKLKLLKMEIRDEFLKEQVDKMILINH